MLLWGNHCSEWRARYYVTILLQGEPIRLNREKYKVYPVSFLLEGKDTINYQDRNGYKHGLWKNYNPEGNLLSEQEYEDDAIIAAKYYDGKGHLQSYFDRAGNSKRWDQDQHLVQEIQAKGDTIVTLKYYPNGTRKQECIRIRNKKERCRYWNWKGELKRR
jgi:YD repeat-containing protein